MKTDHAGGAAPARLVCAVLGLAALIGCGKDDLIAGTSPVAGSSQSLEYWVSLLDGDARRWYSLQSDCVIVVRNPRIQRPGNQVAFSKGRLAFVKPGKVRLEAFARKKPLIQIVGDGQVFRADMPAFNDAYAGVYADVRSLQMDHIPLLPADVADAFDPRGLLTGYGQLLTQWERFTAIDSIRLIREPVPEFVKVSAMLIDRATERVSTIEKYSANGWLRSRVTVTRNNTLPAGEGEPVSVPTDFLIEYPAARTVIRVMLTDPELNVEIDPALFDVSK